MNDGSAGPNSHRWLKAATLAAGYSLLGKLSLEPPLLDGDLGRIVWPASGLALAALLRFGVGMWPGVALGAFMATVATSGALVHGAATAAGNALEVVLAASLFSRLGHDLRFERARDVLTLVVAAIAGAAVSAVFGTIGLFLSDVASAGALAGIWWRWWLGHAMGMLVLTPFLLTIGPWLRRPRSARQWIESVAMMASLAAVGSLAFGSGAGMLRDYNLEYLPFPLLIWAAFRSGPPGAAVANVITAGMAVLGSASGTGPFAGGTPTETLVLTWSFVNLAAVTTLLLAAVLIQAQRAQEAQRKSESQYQLLIDQAADGILIADANGRCTDVNRSGREMLGYDRGELLAHSVSDLVAPVERDEARAQLEALEPGKAAISRWHLQRRDGSHFPAEVSVKRLDDGRLQAFVRDVTERQTLEEQLHHSQKMEAVGILAGGVAHDFNNLLTAIIGHTDFARAHLPPNHKVRADIDEVGKAAGRAAELTRQLLAFARKQIVEPRVVVLGDLVENLETLLRRVVGEDVDVSTKTDDEAWPIKVDPVQLEQVILNIAINARDAMPSGGRLILECGHTHWTTNDNRPGLDMAPGAYATLTITDTGHGMDPETLSRVFEPFFSTKGRSQGTGLGLAVSYGIVKQAGGYIWASSTPGSGTTFRIYLPRAKETESGDQIKAPVAAPRPAETRAGGETILLIEDEPLVRELAVEVLHSRHYHVLTARDGEEALEIARAHPNEIHLTVTDVVLPAMSGKEVAQRLRRARPTLKVLFMSGYAEEQIVHRGIVDKNVAFLSKPFTPDALSEKVRGVLDQ